MILTFILLFLATVVGFIGGMLFVVLLFWLAGGLAVGSFAPRSSG